MADRGQREGQQLGNYRLMQLLGQGHWASVYLGQHRHLHMQAAIKVLHEPLAPSEVEGFLSEARTLAHLRHPHIVRILDFGLQEDTPFLVMDYAPGGTLRKLHPHGARLPLETVVSYVKQVASALQYASEQRLIHRDLKPENLLLGPEQQVWLADFGLAVVAQSARSQPLQQTAGTLAYMAPEQLKGLPTPASDQYALGVMVYEWLCGEQPFSGSFAELAVKHTLVPPPSLTKKVPTLPVGVEDVVLKALAKDPEQRFANVQAFALALEAACRMDAFSGQTLPLLSLASPALAQHVSKHNLPAQLTPLLGRRQEVAAVSTLLRRPEVRLVTLTGTGGIGKTRLAVHVATELLADFPDGVSLVSLAPISDPALVLSTIAQILDVKESGARPLPDLLTAFLRDKHLLLCLDNFEQLLPAAPHLTDLLTKCPHLTILVTSRAVLHVQGEHVFPVPPLAVPDLTQLPPTADTLPHYAAVALFLQRAQAIQPTFQLTSTNARPLAEVCIRLEGLPLAIELAAARITLLPPQALLARLSRRLQVLTGGPLDAPARQQTLRNTIAWSYNLLTVEEQRLFRRLSIFVGGCALEAAEAVCNAASNLAMDVLDGVTSLLNKSLLQQTEQEGEEPRLLMLEIIREYGVECLAACGELEATRQAHAAYYLRLAEEAEQKLRSAQQALWLERLEQEHGNLRAALRWLVEREEFEMALRLGGALYQFWTTHGHLSEGRQWLEGILLGSSTEMVSPLVRAKALTDAGMMACMQGNYSRAQVLCQESLELFRKLDNQPGIATSIKGLAFVALARGDYAAASALLEESLVLLRALGDKWNLAEVLFFAAIAATYRLEQVDTAAARSMVEESLALSKELGDQRIQAYSLNHLGFLYLLQGEGAAACPLIEESLAIHEALGNREGIAYTSLTFGWLSLSQGDYVAARAHYEKSLAILIDLDNKWFTAASLEGLAMAAAQSAAEGSAASALWAARLWGTADALREVIGAPMRSFERAINEWGIASIRTRLGEEAFAAAWAEGRKMTPQQTLAARGPVTLPEQIPSLPQPTISTKAAPAYPAGLTLREVEVLQLLARGLTNAQIAEALVVSLLTVKAHLRSIYSKLGVTSRSAAARYALEYHLS